MSEEQRHRRMQLGAIAVFVVIVAIVVVVVSAGGGDDSSGGTDTAVEDLFAGIPQSGTVLGEPDAPATMYEFADLQCPFCAEFTTGALPTVVEDYVRPGDLALDFQPLAFIGEDSQEAALFAGAAAEQDLMWQFLDVFYANQEAENSGYVDEDYLREIGDQVEGLDVDQALEDAQTPAAAEPLEAGQALADELGVESTPTFAIQVGNGEPELIEPAGLDADSISAALDQALAGSG